MNISIIGLSIINASPVASKPQGFMFDYNFHLALMALQSDYNLILQLCATSAVLKARSGKPSRLVEGESGKNTMATRRT